METTTFVMQRTERHASNRHQIATMSLRATTSAITGTGVSAAAGDITYSPTVVDPFSNDVIDGNNIPTRSASGSPPG